ncbi:uncharacterized protein TRIVIDRAFT_226720 [Trichoderma virens Gv29-8]|uniref:Uncharacterized protein n=1 Tax=Hypocrea virens (strain Gv29-8 / FGSC 10586) TaxID=413071 RepID=G9N6L7_HYPVG|nr:uncharacterized protein TRIVIDRAFT_226720 [Trichoderma virens Gv29-8]EHK17777.1 hypothetical protein TRIVIDRAFT_226720 [Trichoderma virens Gv29-8]UKZ53510.1 hypothetical protein TrVGV298_007302 [Trichoderma virens]
MQKISEIEGLESQTEAHATATMEYRRKILQEVETLCNDLLRLIDESHMPTASTGQSKVYYDKIDLNDKSRKLSIKNLHGCVNDVKALKAFLDSKYEFKNPVVFTSPTLEKESRVQETYSFSISQVMESDWTELRTPGWSAVPNLLIDELAVEYEAHTESCTRDAKSEVSWLINPEVFTLMAACDDKEAAAEITVNGKVVGAFTYTLLNYLEQGFVNGICVDYLTIRHQVAQQLKKQGCEHQKPKIYGRDRLLFLGSMEPFLTVFYTVRIEGDKVIITVEGSWSSSKVGVTSFHSTSGVVIYIEEVDNFECSATISAEDARTLLTHNSTVIVSHTWAFELTQILTHDLSHNPNS